MYDEGDAGKDTSDEEEDGGHEASTQVEQVQHRMSVPCGKTFWSRRNVEMHQEKVHQFTVCVVCTTVTDTSNMEEHMKERPMDGPRFSHTLGFLVQETQTDTVGPL